MEIREISIDDLVLEPNLNLRDRLDEFTVERYAEVWDRMPPITVFEVEGRLLVADGFHRHAAAVHLHLNRIKVEVRVGTFEEALDYVAGANLSHGLPLTRSERRRAVEVKLRIHYDWSDRRMSVELGVSRELVAKIRLQLIDAHQIPSDVGRVGADGKTYPAAPIVPPEERPVRGKPAEPPESRPLGPGAAPWELPAGEGRPRPVPTPREMIDAKTSPAQAQGAPPIDELLTVMAQQVQEVVNWSNQEGFAEAYRLAGASARGLFQTACFKLAARAEQLRKGA